MNHKNDSNELEMRINKIIPKATAVNDVED